MVSSSPKLMKQLVLLCCVGILLSFICLPEGVYSKRQNKKHGNDNGPWNNHYNKDDYAPIKDPGYDISFTQELSYWQCDEETGITLLGRAHNLVLDRHVGRNLCSFLNEKRRHFDKEFNIWEKNLKKSVDSRSVFTRWMVKLWHLMTLKKPHFFITAKVHKWYPFAYDGYGHSKHRFSASFSYELPRVKNLYGAFDGMDAKFAYVDKDNYANEYVDIAASPVLSRKREDGRTFMNEWWSAQNVGYKRKDIINDIESSLQPSDDFSMGTGTFQNIRPIPILKMKPVHFWEDFKGVCNGFDGRFMIRTDGRNPTDNACLWVQNILATDAVDHPHEYITRDVTLDIHKADFFNSKRVGFCGLLASTGRYLDSRERPLRDLHSRTICFFANNLPSKQTLFNDEERQERFYHYIKLRAKDVLAKREAERLMQERLAALEKAALARAKIEAEKRAAEAEAKAAAAEAAAAEWQANVTTQKYLRTSNLNEHKLNEKIQNAIERSKAEEKAKLAARQKELNEKIQNAIERSKAEEKAKLAARQKEEERKKKNQQLTDQQVREIEKAIQKRMEDKNSTKAQNARLYPDVHTAASAPPAEEMNQQLTNQQLRDVEMAIHKKMEGDKRVDSTKPLYPRLYPDLSKLSNEYAASAPPAEEVNQQLNGQQVRNVEMAIQKKMEDKGGDSTKPLYPRLYPDLSDMYADEMNTEYSNLYTPSAPPAF